MLKLLLIILTLYLIFGCGEASQHEPREIKTLYFGGSATNGISYQCGDRNGISKTSLKNGIEKYGTITCIYAPLSFSIGSLKLGEVKSFSNQQIIYPQTLIENFDGDFNNEEVLKIAILLQSLDDKKHQEYMNIPSQIQDKINLQSLKELSVKELYQEIEAMGITPVSAEDAKIHLILNSENSNMGKPIIQYFEEDISSSLPVGSVIGKLSIEAGDGTLNYPFSLEGEDSSSFLLNDKGKLILTQQLDKAINCKLKVTASNQYGYSTQTIKIHVKASGKIGKAQMGRLKGATVKLFKLHSNGNKELIGSTTTQSEGTLNQIGNFDLMLDQVEDHEFYLYEVSGGVDIDRDDDRIEDDNASINLGKLRLLSKGVWIKNSMHKIRITPLSEMLYIHSKDISYDNLENALHKHASLLLKASLDANHNINAKDIMIFDPTQDQALLYPTLDYNQTYKKILNKIRQGNKSYQSDILGAYIIDSFNSNAMEIIGSTVYTVDMMESGNFQIYDLDTKKIIGKLKLPNTPSEEDSHVIYINLQDNDVRVSSLSDWCYYINIKNQNHPILFEDPFIEYVIISGNFNQTALGRSNSRNILSQEKSLYFYDIGSNENSTKWVEFYYVDNPTIQYKFDSKLINIESLWKNQNYLYLVGDHKLQIFNENRNKIQWINTYHSSPINGNILGIENQILYILNHKHLTLLDISSPAEPKYIESFSVPFEYKLGIKTNGDYITTGSKIIDIPSLRASKRAK